MWIVSERDAPGASDEWYASLINVLPFCCTATRNEGVASPPRFATV
jgi:hypothetical protein